MRDDQRPTLTVTYPAAGANPQLDRILVGLYDAYSGIREDSFLVTADFAVDGVVPGQDLSSRFKPKAPGVRELILATPVTSLPAGKLKVSVKAHRRRGQREHREDVEEGAVLRGRFHCAPSARS